MSKQKIFKTGNSLAVTISSRFAQSLGVKPGQEVEVRVDPSTGRMICYFSGTKQLPLSDNFVKRARQQPKLENKQIRKKVR